jgi:hypothetical protein
MWLILWKIVFSVFLVLAWLVFMWFILIRDLCSGGMSGWYVNYYPKCNRYYICRKVLGILNVIVMHENLVAQKDNYFHNHGYPTAESAKEAAEAVLKEHYEKKQAIASRAKEWKEKPKIRIDYKQISGMVEIEATKKHLAELHKYYNIPE